MEYKKEIEELVQTVVHEGASDLHLSEGRNPSIRVSGNLIPLIKKPILSASDMKGISNEFLSDRNKQILEKERSADFSYSLTNVRFRGNVYYRQGQLSIALRLIPKSIRTLSELHLPPVLESFTRKPQGFFLCVGPIGQGKTTTLASLIEIINQTRSEHILTIEDPIEYVHSSKKALITQREVGNHTESFVSAIKSALRQDPDVIMVGEMRDRETIQAALTLAETGHLVFSTLHTIDSVQTIDRIIGIFPAEEQPQVRIQLAGTLQGVVSQTLIQTKDAKSRLLAAEVLICNGAVRNCILEAKTQQIYSLLQLGKNEGMQSINDALQILKDEGKI
jgi:twitching motility protein PilT